MATPAAGPRPETKFVHRKPTDRNIPDVLLDVIPEAKLYRDLQDAEKRLDATITRKKLDLQDAMSRNAREKRVLRVFVSNTASNQSWQQGTDTDGGVPEWNLRIEGRLVNDEPADAPGRERFSTFFSSIVVEFPPGSVVDNDGEPSDIIEWHEPVHSGAAPNVEFDVFDIRRRGSENLPARISLQIKEYPDRFRLSPKLATLLAIEEDTKPNVVVALWQYIKFHKLQDADEKRLVKCDHAMRETFGLEQIMFPHIMDLLGDHLKPAEPTVIDYTVRVDKQSTMGEAVYDVLVERNDPIKEEMATILENWYSTHTEVGELDEQIALTVEALNTSRLKREFFRQLASDPAEFVKRWVASQSRDLKTISSDKAFNEYDVRRSDFYTDDVLNQTLHYFLYKN